MCSVPDDELDDVEPRSECVQPKKMPDEHIANQSKLNHEPVSDKSSQSECHQKVNSAKNNIGIVGGPKCGKSSLINALRGLTRGETNAAGRYSCHNMEAYSFDCKEFENTVLWEIPYFDIFGDSNLYERNTRMEQYYETQNLDLFKMFCILIPSGVPNDNDLIFSKFVYGRQTPIVFVCTKFDERLHEIRQRKPHLIFDERFKNEIAGEVRQSFLDCVHRRVPLLENVQLFMVSSTVLRQLIREMSATPLYAMDDENFLRRIGLRPAIFQNSGTDEITSNAMDVPQLNRSIVLRHRSEQIVDNRPSILADAGFEIIWETDDRVDDHTDGYRRARKTTFNYAFIGRRSVGKSTLIDAIRGISPRHPTAAVHSTGKPGMSEAFFFDDDLLAYRVTLWEMHYPHKISEYFEFIDRHQLAAFTAVFILTNGIPRDEDASFATIAFRRNATVVFLKSKCDKELRCQSRSTEIPICDLLKRQFVDKAMDRFERKLRPMAPELCGRVHLFLISSYVFRALRTGEGDPSLFLLHERAVFDFLKQKRMIAEILRGHEMVEFEKPKYATIHKDCTETTLASTVS